jgi:hypothetical protein
MKNHVTHVTTLLLCNLTLHTPPNYYFLATALHCGNPPLKSYDAMNRIKILRSEFVNWFRIFNFNHNIAFRITAMTPWQKSSKWISFTFYSRGGNVVSPRKGRTETRWWTPNVIKLERRTLITPSTINKINVSFIDSFHEDKKLL